MTFVFTRSPALISRLIMWMQSGRCSHVGIGADLHGLPVVVHADWKVRVSPRAHFLLDRTVVAEFALKQDASRGFAQAVGLIDLDYDIVGAFGFGLVALAWKWFRRKIRNPLASPKAEVCSEFAVTLGACGEVPSLKGIDPTTILPEPLLEICEQNPDDFEPLPQGA